MYRDFHGNVVREANFGSYYSPKERLPVPCPACGTDLTVDEIRERNVEFKFTGDSDDTCDACRDAA